MLRPRFSLRLLLIVTAVSATFLAASQVHRRRVMRTLAPFEDAGVAFVYDDGWLDMLWMRRPTQATLPIFLSQNGEISSLLFDDSRGSDYLISQAMGELREIGVTDVTTVVIRR